MRPRTIALLLAATLTAGCSDLLTEPATGTRNVSFAAASAPHLAELQVVNASTVDFVSVGATPCEASMDTVQLGEARARVGATPTASVHAGCNWIVIRHELHAQPAHRMRARVEIPVGQKATVRFVNLGLNIPRP